MAEEKAWEDYALSLHSVEPEKQIETRTPEKTQREKPLLLERLDGMLGTPQTQGEYEIEARIGRFQGNRFISSIEAKDFFRILEYFLTHLDELFVYQPQEVLIRTEQLLEELPHFPDSTEEAIYEVNVGKPYPERIREAYVPNVPNAPRFYSKKQNRGNVDFPDHFIRFSKSLETPLGTEHPQLGKPQALRIKDRWSFSVVPEYTEHPLFPYRIDMTHVTGWTKNKDAVTPINSYEVELEIIHYPITKAETELWPGIHFMLELVQNTPWPVTAGTISNVITSFNALFTVDIRSLERAMQKKSAQKWRFSPWKLFNVVNKPVNLKLVVLDTPDKLAITDKADGERRLMFIRSDGAYLVYPPVDVMRYLKLENDEKLDVQLYTISSQHANALAGTIFDGELVITNDGKREYLVFDLLVDAKKDYRQTPFIERITRLKEILATNPINVKLKHFLFPQNGNFYTRTAQIMASITDKEYGNDGLIFNSIQDSYDRGTVYKWKPPEMLTIDFKIRQDPSNPTHFNLFVKRDKSPEFVIFTGTSRFPFDGYAVIDPPIVNKMPLVSDRIVEMNWNGEMFVPFRIRHDRDMPNNQSTALSVWKDIMEPITVETILGIDLRALRRYQNSIKKRLIEICGYMPHVVDIASGVGGDLHKFTERRAQVVAVEPEEGRLEEYRRRLEQSGYKMIAVNVFQNIEHPDTKILLVRGYGQETNRIIDASKDFFGAEQSVNCVSIFNGLTFFFDKESSLDSLVETISQVLIPGGFLLGIAMDGGLVKRLLIKNSDLKERISKLKEDQFFNIDSKKAINERSLSKNFYVNEELRLVSKNEKELDEMVEKLSEPDSEKIEEHSWEIQKTSEWSNSPFGNQISIYLKDTIVSDPSKRDAPQIEYLVDFEEFVKKLKAKNILLEDDFFLSTTAMSRLQQKLNGLYRAFVFKRAKEEQPAKEITVHAVVGGYKRKIVEKQRHLKLLEKLKQNSLEKIKDITSQMDAFEEMITKMHDNGKKITKQVANELIDKKEGLKGKLVIAEESLEKHIETIDNIHSEIKELEEKLATTKEETIIVPKELEQKPRGKKPKKLVSKIVSKVGPSVVPPVSPQISEETKAQTFKLPKKKTQQISITSESEKIITTFEEDPDVSFKAIEYQNILFPEQQEPITIKGINFVRIGTEDGSCVVSALLRAGMDKYIIGKNKSGASPLTDADKRMRKDSVNRVIETLVNKIFKPSYEKGNLTLVKKYYPDWETAYKVLKKCQNWTWLDLWENIARIFKFNIVIITADSPFTIPTIYKTKSIYEKTVIVYSHDGVFDVVSQKDGNGDLVTIFAKDDVTINIL
jgi:hypothetical protein